METSQPLSIESFSYSWLVNLNPSFENSIDASDEASFIEMDPNLSSSKRFFKISQDFDFPLSESPLTLVHADELISNGFLIPLFVNPLKKEQFDPSDLDLEPEISSKAQKNLVSASKIRCSSIRRCRNLSKLIFQKYFDYMKPFYRKLRGGRRSSSRIEAVDNDARMEGEKIWVRSNSTSPRTSVGNSADNWRRSFDSESSIYEAVLHCKKSNGK